MKQKHNNMKSKSINTNKRISTSSQAPKFLHLLHLLYPIPRLHHPILPCTPPSHGSKPSPQTILRLWFTPTDPSQPSPWLRYRTHKLSMALLPTNTHLKKKKLLVLLAEVLVVSIGESWDPTCPVLRRRPRRRRWRGFCWVLGFVCSSSVWSPSRLWRLISTRVGLSILSIATRSSGLSVFLCVFKSYYSTSRVQKLIFFLFLFLVLVPMSANWVLEPEIFIAFRSHSICIYEVKIAGTAWQWMCWDLHIQDCKCLIWSTSSPPGNT